MANNAKDSDVASVTSIVIGSIIRAGLNTAPFAGGIASLWSDWDTNRRFDRVERAVRELSNTLAAFGGEFDAGKLGDAEMHLLEDVMNRVSREHREWKRQHFVELLTSHWVHTDWSFEERILFDQALDAFTDVHLRVLRFLLTRKVEGAEPIKGDAFCPAVFPERSEDDFRSSVFIPAVNKLAAEFGFIRRRGLDAGHVFGLNPDGFALFAIFEISPLGERFIRSLPSKTPTRAAPHQGSPGSA